MQASERVIVIKGNATKWYSQAVFILNPSALPEEIPIDFVAEAEKIIHDYMAKKHGNAYDSIHAYMAESDMRPAVKARKRFRLGFLLYVLMVLACIGMAAVIGFGLLR